MDEMDILRELESHGCCGLDQLDAETLQWIERSAKYTGFLIVVDQSIPIDAFDQFTGPERLRGSPIIVAAYCDPPVRIWRVEPATVYVVTHSEIESAHVEGVYANRDAAERVADSLYSAEYRENGIVEKMEVVK